MKFGIVLAAAALAVVAAPVAMFVDTPAIAQKGKAPPPPPPPPPPCPKETTTPPGKSGTKNPNPGKPCKPAKPPKSMR